MEKKYTLEEFKEYFDKIKLETIKELTELIDDESIDSDFRLVLGIQNIIAIDTMRKNIFK